MELKKVGTIAPNFKLLNQDEKEIELKSFRGKKNVLVYFYPKALTPGCTVQACKLTDFKKKFSAKKTVILGLSPDEPSKLKKFQEKQSLKIDLLSDPEHKVADKYGVWGLKKFMGKEYMGINRITFIVGMDGKIKHIMDKVKTKTHHEEALEWISNNL